MTCTTILTVEPVHTGPTAGICGGAVLAPPGSLTTAARTSAHHNRFGPELPWHHVLHLSPRDGPTHHIDLCKSPQTPTFAHSQIRTFLARFYMNALLRRRRFEPGGAVFLRKAKALTKAISGQTCFGRRKRPLCEEATKKAGVIP